MERMLGVEELLNEAGWLRRLAAGLVGDGAQAEDLLQDTWLAALRHPPSTARDTRPWLARVVRNLARNAGRDRARRESRESFAHEERVSPDPSALAQAAEAQRVLAEAVTRLAEPLRAVIVLRYFQGLDSGAAAAQLGVPASTVRTRTQKALEELRAELDRRAGGRRSWALLLAPLARGAGRASAPAASVTAGALALSSSAAWLAWGGAACVVVALGALGWRATRQDGASASSPPALPLAAVASASVPAASSPVAGAREELASLDIGGGAAAGAAPSAAAVIAERPTTALTGTVLVDGRPPEWPLRLTLEPGLSAEPVVGETKLLRRVKAETLTLQPDSMGAFAFTALAPDWSGRLVVSDYRFADGQAELALAAPTTGLVLQLVSGPEILGRIHDPDGRPSAGLEGSYRLSAGHDGQPALASRTQRFVCRADGRFRIPSARVGEWAVLALRVEAAGRGFLQHETPAFAPAAGFDVGELGLEPLRALTFTVRDPLGAPLQGAFARVDGPSTTKRVPLTGADGSGVLAFAPERAVDVRFSAFGFADRVLRVEPGDAPEVVLEPLSVLSIRLLGSARAEAALVRLSAERPAFRWDQEGWDGEALFQLELGNVPPPERRAPNADEARYVYEFELVAGESFLLAGVTPDVVLTVEALDAQDRVLAAGTTSLGHGQRAALELGTADGSEPVLRQQKRRMGSDAKGEGR